jgi:zinc protease
MNLSQYINIQSKTLNNGLKLVLIDKPDINTVSINLAYKVGSRSEIPGKTGMAHLFEHLMFEGSKNIPKGDFDKICTLAGGTNNAYTTFDMTAYTMTLPSNQLELGLWLESDRMLEFSVNQHSLDTQKKVVTEEIRQTVFDQPYGRWRELLAVNSFSKSSPYSWEVHGSIDDVESVKLVDLEDFFFRFYCPENACITICGRFDNTKTINLVEKYFGNIPPANVKRNILDFSSSQQLSNKMDSYFDSVPLTAVFNTFHIPGFMNDLINQADIISNIAGGGRSSRLFSELVESSQIASSVGAYVDKREETSLLIFYAISNDTATTADILNKELGKIIDSFKVNPSKAEEFNKTINQLTTQVAYEIQYSSGLADIASTQMLFWNDPERVYSLLDNYKKISMNELSSFASEYLDLKKMIRIDVLPMED